MQSIITFYFSHNSSEMNMLILTFSHISYFCFDFQAHILLNVYQTERQLCGNNQNYQVFKFVYAGDSAYLQFKYLIKTQIKLHHFIKEFVLNPISFTNLNKTFLFSK